MPPLRNLEIEFPTIDANFKRFCASHGILSVEDFLVHDLSKLVSLAEAEARAEELKEERPRSVGYGYGYDTCRVWIQLHIRSIQGVCQILSFIDGQHQPWLNGVQLLQNAMWNKHFLSTGCKGIDMLLEGGLREGQLTEVVGPSSSGKTQVCLRVASHVADNHLGVVFLDTCNSFSARRIACIIDQFSGPSVKEVKERRHKRIMTNIICQPVYDLFELLDVLHQLEFSLKQLQREVQHLIERCLLFHMNKEECMEALNKHANIMPVITSTVWTELVKENGEFFESYARNRERALEMETMQRIERTLQETAARDTDDED